MKINTRETFDLEISDVSHESACVEFQVSYRCNRKFIDFFKLKIWEEGSTSNIVLMRQIGRGRGDQGPPKFETEINDGNCEFYTLYNLEPAFAYRIQVVAYQRDITKNYDPKADKESRYQKIPSETRFFNTASKPIDQYIEEELMMARETRRQKGRSIKLAQSERLLYEFSKDHDPDQFVKHSKPVDNDETLQQSLMAARKHKSWLDYAKCGFKHQPRTHADKRLQRFMLIGQAIDAFEDVPREEKGQRIMEGDWKMGPFYAWDQNFMKYGYANKK